jgi:hypothetical protein
MQLQNWIVFPPQLDEKVHVPIVYCKHCKNITRLDAWFEEASTTDAEAKEVIEKWFAADDKRAEIYGSEVREGFIRSNARIMLSGLVLLGLLVQLVGAMLNLEESHKEVRILVPAISVSFWNLFGHPKKTLTYWSIFISILCLIAFLFNFLALHPYSD